VGGTSGSAGDRGAVVSINTSDKRGTAKAPVAEAEFREAWGIVGDAHAGPGDRQVSLLSEETIERMNRMLAELAASGGPEACPKAGADLGPGAFAENLTLRGIDFSCLVIGRKLRIGAEVVAEVSKIGKECHSHCEIFKRLGKCPMPKEGVFVRVIHGGTVRAGDEVRIHANGHFDDQ
jgi:MOSC domain-containing protein YiiM